MMQVCTARPFLLCFRCISCLSQWSFYQVATRLDGHNWRIDVDPFLDPPMRSTPGPESTCQPLKTPQLIHLVLREGAGRVA